MIDNEEIDSCLVGHGRAEKVHLWTTAVMMREDETRNSMALKVVSQDHMIRERIFVSYSTDIYFNFQDAEMQRNKTEK